MKHKHANLIAKWNEDNSIEFEFAYGTGVDFTWADCDITHVIKNPSAQVRVKDVPPKKERVWIAFEKESGNVYGTFSNQETCHQYHPKLQIIEIEVEV